MSLIERFRDHGERELLLFIIEQQELFMSQQDDINAAVAALNALVADFNANPRVDTTALNAAVASADSVLNPPTDTPPPADGAAVDANAGTSTLDANGQPVSV